MTIVIHKQQLTWDLGPDIGARVSTFKPGGEVLRLLEIQLQNGVPTLWYEVNLSDSQYFQSEIQLQAIGTGHERPDSPWVYIGTTQQNSFVWHWYGVRKILAA